MTQSPAKVLLRLISYTRAVGVPNPQALKLAFSKGLSAEAVPARRTFIRQFVEAGVRAHSSLELATASTHLGISLVVPAVKSTYTCARIEVQFAIYMGRGANDLFGRRTLWCVATL